MPKLTIFKLLFFLSVFTQCLKLFSPVNVFAQNLNDLVCAGPLLYNNHLTFCAVVNVNGQLAPGYGGCGFGQQCWVGDAYQGCSGVNLNSCAQDTYDSAGCIGTAAADTPWNASSCTSQKQGCFIPYPGAGGGGVCVPPKAQVTFSCSNPPNTVCQSSAYNLCFENPQSAGFGQYDKQYCDCADSIASGEQNYLCYFRNRDTYDAAKTKWENDNKSWDNAWCPVCPTGYYADSFNKVCQALDDTNPISKTNPLSFSACSQENPCNLFQDGAGCEKTEAGCRPRKDASGATIPCGGDQQYTCHKGDLDYCCPDANSCTKLGGTETKCIEVSALTGVIGDCNVQDPTHPITCNALVGLNQKKSFCCTTTGACKAVGRSETPTSDEQPQCDPGTGELTKNGGGIFTAIGCIPFDLVTRIVAFFVSWGLGVGGGWAILLLLYGGGLVMTSSGDPTKLQAGKELIISSISGVFMLIFSVFILRTIGIDVLGLF